MKRMKKLAVLLAALMLVSALSGTLALAATYKSGTYTGSAKGFGGTVTATVKIQGDKIVSITAKGDKETAGVGSVAISKLPAAMVSAQKANVDAKPRRKTS